MTLGCATAPALPETIEPSGRSTGGDGLKGGRGGGLLCKVLQDEAGADASAGTLDVGANGWAGGLAT